MALLKITTLADANPGGNRVVVNQRLYLTGDGAELVEEGDKRAAFLFCSPGKAVERAELARLGVDVDGDGKKRDKGKTDDKRDGSAANKSGTTGAGIDGNVKQAKRTIAGVETIAELDELDKLEAAREGGPRAGVTKALANRRADLEE